MPIARTSAARRALPAPTVFEDVLVHTDDSAASLNALAYAEAMAPEGHIAALVFGMIPDYPASEFAAEAWLSAQRDAEQRADQLEKRLRDTLVARGSRAELRRADIMSGDEGRAFATQALYADVAVVGWPTADAAEQPVGAFEGVLFQSGRPVILVPAGFTGRGLPGTVLIAWTSSREAARAVNDAIPLLKSASAVRIVVVADSRNDPEENPGDDIARHLARHGITVDVRHVPDKGELVYRVLLDEARFVGADLVVMGGYSHSRTGEWLFGGVTRDMLGKMTVPVFMSH